MRGTTHANGQLQDRRDQEHLRHLSQVDGIHIMAIFSRSLSMKEEERAQYMPEFDDVAFLIDNRVARGRAEVRGCSLVMILGLDHSDDRRSRSD